MPQTSVAVITQHTSHSVCLVVVVYDQRFYRAAYDAGCDLLFYADQGLVRQSIPKPSPVDGAAIGGSACSAPTVKPVQLPIVRREKLASSGFLISALCTS